ncbi:dynein light chain Tctex-type protein 2 isoform X3 [Pantherophis guttatus]|uniref:Dynein light chain Tctex-type protein 2 isoform X3 n=1 Tax=Pantherophis guttatus TaxID=94885 RepID=A0ABM3ZIY8_PANGU|nr:dynein light chain Tctex-type protein 2 isoform X3 [Pantherophis guttatus]
MDKAKKKLGVTPSHAGQAWGRKHSGLDRDQLGRQKLQDFKYIGINGAPTCTAISEDILAGVKELGFDRYKYIVQLFLVEKTGQSIHIASRWVWDVARDTWVQAQYETENYVMVALVVASYFE